MAASSPRHIMKLQESASRFWEGEAMAMSRFGGTVLKTSLSQDDEKELQDALHCGQVAAQ